jgi:uncharacterized membrane protein YdjX (TVP38/TMEM64 family)
VQGRYACKVLIFQLTGIFVTEPLRPSAPRSSLRRWLPLLVLASIALLIVVTGAHRWLSLDAVAMNKGRLEALVDSYFIPALLAFMATYVLVTALSLPGALIMTIVGGLIFPFWVSCLAVVVSATTGATILFLIAGSSLGEALRARGGDNLARISAGLRADAASYMLFLRLVPLFPFALVNIAPAIVGVPVKTFIWTTLVGVLPGTMAFTLAANSLDGVLDERKAVYNACKTLGQPDCKLTIDVSTLVSPKLLLAFAALGVIALIPVIAKRIFARRKGVPVA